MPSPFPGMDPWLEDPWMYADLRIELGYADGGHEPWLQELLKSQLAAGDCYYDLGSHAGFFALIAARQVGHSGAVLAVEPDPDNVQVVQANVTRNKLTQITVLQAAVWSSYTRLNFEPNPLHPFSRRVTSVYSQRIACIGSIPAARTAGSSEAALAINARAAIDPANAHGSRVEVP